MVKANAQVAASLFRQAVGAPAQYDDQGHKIRGEQLPVVAAAIFWTKARMGWRETSAVEMTGKDGAAIPLVVTKNQSNY